MFVAVVIAALALVGLLEKAGPQASIFSISSVSQLLVATDAYWQTAYNVSQITENPLAIFNGKQYLAYVGPSRVPKFAVRTLSNNSVSVVATGLPAISADDIHSIIAVSIDTDGYIHISYGMHGIALIYYRSANPEDPSSWTGPLSMLGTNETNVTYPMFTKSPTTGALYFTFRAGGSGIGSQYFYSYNTGTKTWGAATGTGTAGLFIDYTSDSSSAYLDGAPKWAPNGNLWWVWSIRDNGTQLDSNKYAAFWTGTDFKKSDGSSQTIPVRAANNSPVVTVSPEIGIQNDFNIGSDGTIYVGYFKPVSGNQPMFVAENSSGSFVEHQVTTVGALSSICTNTKTAACYGTYTTMMPFGNVMYAVQSDVYQWPTRAPLRAYRSVDHFSTFVGFDLLPYAGPNFIIDPDPTRLSTVVSFPFTDANEPSFGYTPLNSGGNIYIFDWTPGLAPGM